MEIKVKFVMCLVCGHIERVNKTALKYINGSCRHCGIKFIEVRYNGTEVSSSMRFDLIRGELQPSDIKCSEIYRKNYLAIKQEESLKEKVI